MNCKMWKEKVHFLGVQIYCMMTNPLFYVSILIVTLMCFTAPLYMNTTTLEDETVFHVLLSKTRGDMLESEEFSFYYALRKGKDSWMTMFVPIVSALSFIPLCQDTRKSGAMRYQIARVGKTGYFGCTMLAGFINGALVFLAGYMLYTAIVAVCFPAFGEYDRERQSLLIESVARTYSLTLYGENSLHIFGIVLAEWLSFAAYGGYYGICATLFLNMSDNAYLALCVPFFIKYCLNQLYTKLLMIDLYAGAEHFDQLQIVDPEALLSLFVRNYPWQKVLIFCAILILVIYFLGRFLNNRREDCGK